MSVAIIDYGMCNLGSVRRAFEECGADVVMASQPEQMMMADRIVLPGVGAYAKGMKNLLEGHWVEAIDQKAMKEKVPVLGICLGMHLMSDFGVEGGHTKGLGLISGGVQKLNPTSNETRIPHVGWNEIHFGGSHPILKNIDFGDDFYFVHSFHFVCSDSSVSVAETPYCGKFSSIIAKDNIVGVQFHPEKSSKPGFRLIKNFLAI